MRKRKTQRKQAVLAARHTIREWRPSKEPAAELLPTPALAAPAGVSGTSGTSGISILIAALLAASVLLVGTALLPPAVLPASRVGAIIAHHRADLATAGLTGAVCLLFAFVIAWMA